MVALRALAAFLVLWTPFFVFVAQRDYPLTLNGLIYSAAWCMLAALVLSAVCGFVRGKRQTLMFAVAFALVLDIQFDWYQDAMAYVAFGIVLVLFWVLRRHISTILVTMFGAVLLSTVVFGSFEPHSQEQEGADSASAGRAAGAPGRGIIVHLMLDEFTGIAGIPDDIPGGEDLRRDLREFFTANGFRVFGNAVSEYEATRNSMAGILNFTAGPTPYDFYVGTRPFVLQQNRYFAALAEAGYDIRVYQTHYMDYCSEFPALVNYCYNYPHDSTDWLKTAHFDDVEKLKALLSPYLQRSDEMVETTLKLYVWLAQHLRPHGILMPELPKWDDGHGSVNGMIALGHFIADVVAGPGATAYFGHFLVPHGPYAHRRDCTWRRDVNDWRSNRPPFRRENDENERRLSYAAYFEQIQCVQHKLADLFQRLKAAGRYDDATIIVHGDHGSRIHSVAARANNIDRLQQRDYLAGFSTLFAAKSPAFEPGYDAETAPVSRLLPRAIGRPDLVSDPEAPILIYLEGDDDYEPWTPVPWRISK